MTIQCEKEEKRKALLAKRAAMEHRQADRLITQAFLDSPQYAACRSLMLYVSFGTEINTHPLIKAVLKSGRQIYLPLCHPQEHRLSLHPLVDFYRDLSPGHYGILEPTTPAATTSTLDLVVVPGLAFSPSGHRLGFGGGYYDRFLLSLSPSVTTLALALEDFILPEADLPRDSHDYPVHYLITEKRSMNCKELS